MTAWPLKQIGEICDVNPKLPREHGIADDQSVTFVPMAAVDEVSGTIADRQIRRYAEVKKGYTHFMNDDVLFAKITPCMENGKAAIADNLIGDAGFGSTEFHVLRSKGEVLPVWLFYYVRQPSFRRQAKRNFTGTGGQQRVPTSFLAATKIPVPPISEQRRIVDLLSRAEGIVRLRREAEKKAAELIPALFLDMFGDPVMNQKGWPGASLEYVAQIISGATKGRRLDPAEAIELPYMRVANVKDGRLDLAEVKYIAVKRREIEKYSLMRGDLLMTEGGDPDKLGRAALWSGEIETCLHQNHIFKVRADRKKVLPEYLRELVGSHYGKAYFLRIAKKTTGIATINRTQLGGFPVLLPPLELQAEFVERFTSARSIQSQQSAAIAKARAAFDALLAKAFNQCAELSV
ncbi:MAG TPA: restriction endonuclease subunit S [Aromatoleum sp.]|uniref:restriction endonuclease subunit S n=1 Tax=Aromatoleum sp. TaxID=2307007 RepID=UPI002B47010C|nr:restriction endonuclease subunit S [Aromatoleum sp.]HJV26729.1 restriction endonuclease subunit S [Aromatoleum sp.]